MFKTDWDRYGSDFKAEFLRVENGRSSRCVFPHGVYGQYEVVCDGGENVGSPVGWEARKAVCRFETAMCVCWLSGLLRYWGSGECYCVYGR